MIIAMVLYVLTNIKAYVADMNENFDVADICFYVSNIKGDRQNFKPTNAL
jgi:hypothetical protein